MSTPSWRDLLKDVISDAVERERLAKAMDVNPLTLSRWAQGVSTTPRPQKLSQLVQAFPNTASSAAQRVVAARVRRSPKARCY